MRTLTGGCNSRALIPWAEPKRPTFGASRISVSVPGKDLDVTCQTKERQTKTLLSITITKLRARNSGMDGGNGYNISGNCRRH